MCMRTNQPAEKKNTGHLVSQKPFLTHIQSRLQIPQSKLTNWLLKLRSVDKANHSFFIICCVLDGFSTTCLFWMLVYKKHLSIELNFVKQNLLVGWVPHWRTVYWTYKEKSRSENILRIPPSYWHLWKFWVFIAAGLNSLESGQKLQDWGTRCLQRDGSKWWLPFLSHLAEKNSQRVTANSVNLGLWTSVFISLLKGILDLKKFNCGHFLIPLVSFCC